MAEDAPANQMLVVRLLERRGHKVEVAGDGRQAVTLFDQRPFDLVLMDVQMPEMDGLQATAEIRKRRQQGGGRVPIVALSVLTSRGDRERCLSAGMDACIAKPIDVSQLVELVESFGAKSERAPPVVRPDEPVIDCQASLARLDNDREIFLEMVHFFWNDVPKLLQRLHASIEAGQPGELALAAHTLKGLVANFDANRAGAAASRLEQMGRQQDLMGAAAVCRTLEEEIVRVKRALAEFCAQLSEEKGRA